MAEVTGGDEEALPEGDEAVVRTAMERFNAGDYKGAIMLLDGLSERQGRVLLIIGLSYYRLGDYDNAADFLERAAARDAGDFLSRKFLALAYYRKDDLDRSLSYAEAGLSMREDPQLRSLYGRIKKEMVLQEGFAKEETIHFKVLYDGYEHGGLSRKILSILEDAYGSIGRELNYFPPGQVTVVLHTEEDFFDVTRVPAWSGGAYDGRIRIPVKGLKGDEAVLRRVLYHEYTHALVRSITPTCPQWINEGLAEYFSNSSPPAAVGRRMSLRELEGSFVGLDRETALVAYRVSHSALSFLVNRYGLYRVKDLLFALSEGNDLEEAFNALFPVTYEQFLSDWERG